ncbi:hypothetical protein HH310_18660 [Actinoplanes sp. TBRC 11911]|uniref:hypothetical protein n=1 Tax=Actinoplanes sp. TBRC 11911 TaxID=2729386 RepID=UPI00145EC1BD|nr:hypothetical protein [Actinoplanes sp. TBRC 11911]NMO53207.1 hypothetical protein [Actinoplanes sp. TBRC 11911]
MAFALHKDPADAVRRTRVTLKVVMVTLAWLVIVPLLMIYGWTGETRDDDVFTLAAFLIVLGPFTAAVIATRNQRFGIGATYVVLTLLMIFPAVAIARAA